MGTRSVQCNDKGEEGHECHFTFKVWCISHNQWTIGEPEFWPAHDKGEDEWKIDVGNAGCENDRGDEDLELVVFFDGQEVGRETWLA